MARTLLVLRHAKAAAEAGVSDAGRPLTRRGRRDAAALGGWLGVHGLVPGRVLCSTAQRTRQTWEEVAGGLGDAGRHVDVRFEPLVYDAGVDTLLDLVWAQPDDVATLMTVGHNPTAHALVAELTGRSDLGFPTCSLAVVRVSGPWGGVAAGTAGLAGFWSPHTPGWLD